jgi:RND superfamily putative drug exporter
MAGVLYRLGRLCANRAIVVVAVWLGLVVLVRLVVGGVGAETSNDLSLPGTESQQATDLLASRFPPQQNGSSPVVFHATKGKITDSANKQAVETSSKALAKAPHVASAPTRSPTPPRAWSARTPPPRSPRCCWTSPTAT